MDVINNILLNNELFETCSISAGFIERHQSLPNYQGTISSGNEKTILIYTPLVSGNYLFYAGSVDFADYNINQNFTIKIYEDNNVNPIYEQTFDNFNYRIDNLPQLQAFHSYKINLLNESTPTTYHTNTTINGVSNQRFMYGIKFKDDLNFINVKGGE